MDVHVDSHKRPRTEKMATHMSEERRPIPDVEDVESALSAIMEPAFAPPEWAKDHNVTSAAAVLTLELFGGPAKPKTPDERRERVENLRTLLRKLASRLRVLETPEIEARIRLDLDSEDDREEAYAEEASRLADAVTTIFQLDPEGGKPKKLRKHQLYAQAQESWEEALEDEKFHKQWFERKRLQRFLLPTLAKWIREYEKAHRARSRATEKPKDGDEEPSEKGKADDQVATNDGQAEPKREPVAVGDPTAPRSNARGVLWATAGVVAVLISLVVVFNKGESDSDLRRQQTFPTQPSTSPAPTPSTEFGSGTQTRLYEPTCGVLAASEPDPDDTNRRLAAIDMAVGARRIRQPSDAYPALPFGQVVKIRPFEVVQVSAIVQNAGPNAVARGVRLRLSFPTRPSTRTTIAASTEAANARPNDRYRTSGVVALVSLNGRPFRLDNFRAVIVQRNEKKRGLYWGRFENFPACALESKRTDDGFEVVAPPPSIDGTLGVGLNDAYRLSMLADVNPGRS